MKKNAFPVFVLSLLLISISLSSGSLQPVSSQDNPPQDDTLTLLETEALTPYFTVERYALADGTTVHMDIINGPPQPPPGFEAEREASLVVDASRNTLADFPAYDWVFGCSAVSAAMIAGYYDRTGYPNIYAGPTNGGVMPLSDTAWPCWTDTAGVTYSNNPLVASKSGVDGWVGHGSIENYWVRSYSNAADPYITNSWPLHSWGTAMGDYMKTSQSAYGNIDGSSKFYHWSPTYTSNPLHCSDMSPSVSQEDATYGRKLFYEARGYTVTDCYNQLTDNQVAGGFSLTNFKAQIDAGHPVLLNLQGHSIVGFGYSGSTIYIRDTWDSNPQNIYSMPWGGSYHGMLLRSASIVKIETPNIPAPVAPSVVLASDGTYFDKVRVSWEPSANATAYKVYRNTVKSTGNAVELSSNTLSSPYDDRTAVHGVTYYYWIKACNLTGCSNFSSVVEGKRDFGQCLYLPLITR